MSEENNKQPEMETYRFKNLEEFKIALETEPPEGWIKKRELGGTRESLFIPISVMESNADLIFREWHVIEEKPLSVSNGVGFTVKIQALPDYTGAELIFFTGSGAVPFQDQVKNSVEYCFPAARTRAISNALGELGNIFGRNISRTVNKMPVGSGFTLRKKPAKEEESDQ